MIDRLWEPAHRAADVIETWDFAHVLSHYDADGITAAAVMAHALQRRGIPFQVACVEHFDQAAVDLVRDNAVLCDMGSGSPQLSNQLRGVIIDHHPPAPGVENHQVNPHLVGVNGSTQLSAAGAAYCVARVLGQNEDLAGLALAGAIGDRQRLEEGINADIIAEGEQKGYIRRETGLLWGTDDLREALTYSLDPYLPASGDTEAAEALLAELGVPARLSELDPGQRRRLASTLAAQLVAQSGPKAVGHLIGDVYYLSEELIPDARLLATTVDSCGRVGASGLGVALCMRDEASLEQAHRVRREYYRTVLAAVRGAEANVKTLRSLRYFVTDRSGVAGLVASTLVRYRFGDLPLAVVNRSQTPCRVSVRGNHALVARGLNLSKAVAQAASEVGGTGGGHDVASGAGVPPERVDDFLVHLDRLVGAQLGR